MSSKREQKSSTSKAEKPVVEKQGERKREILQRKIGITETALRDAHQSIMATRLRTEDMVPVAE
jgi:oxaloacetate decarboxylase alpha subunit